MSHKFDKTLCRTTGLQGYKVAGLQGCKVAGLQGYKVAGLQGCRVVVKFRATVEKSFFGWSTWTSTLIKHYFIVYTIDKTLILKHNLVTLQPCNPATNLVTLQPH